MRPLQCVLAGFVISAVFFAGSLAHASDRHVWAVISPDHGQTFTYGMEQNRVWAMRGSDRHLALLLNLTNDPYVDRDNPRQYDSFVFHFPGVTLGSDGHTFYYHAPGGRSVPVATRQPDFLGVEEIHLLPNSEIIVKKSHGYLTLTLIIEDAPRQS